MMCRSSYVAVPFRDQCFRRAIKLDTDDRGWAKALFAPSVSVQSTVSIKVFAISISCWLVFVVSVVEVGVDVYVELA